MDISIDNEPQGRIVYELFNKHVPRTSKNFLELWRGEKENLSYKGTPFHRIIPGLLVSLQFYKAQSSAILVIIS